MKLFVCALAALLLTAAAAAAGSQQGSVAIGKWKLMDKCAKDAQAAFPDFNAEANAKREAKLQECLSVQNLPPRDPATPGH